MNREKPTCRRGQVQRLVRPGPDSIGLPTPIAASCPFHHVASCRALAQRQPRHHPRAEIGKGVQRDRRPALVNGPLRFTPVNDGRHRGYAFEGTVALDRLLAGVVVLPTVVASPSGHVRSWTREIPARVKAVSEKLARREPSEAASQGCVHAWARSRRSLRASPPDCIIVLRAVWRAGPPVLQGLDSDSDASRHRGR